MITEGFRSDVRIRLDYLHIEQTRFPSKYELYKNAIGLLFRTENTFEAINILEAYKFLIDHYEKVEKAMSDKRWVALDAAHFATGRVSLKRSINKKLIYITNYMSKEPQVFSVAENEYQQEPYVKPTQKKESIYESIYDNGEYYLYKKGDRKEVVAKYSTARNKKLFFVRIELLNVKQIDSKEVMKDFIKQSEITEIMEMSLMSIISMPLFRHF